MYKDHGWVNSNAVGTPRETSTSGPRLCVYEYVCAHIRAVDVRRGAWWGDLLTQFVENMTQPRLPLVTYTALRLPLPLSLPLTLSLSIRRFSRSFSPLSPLIITISSSLSFSLFSRILSPLRTFHLPLLMCVRLSLTSSSSHPLS